ncbi:hypothetical protein Y1Q_0018938 [Alligator mississippiensis]|nr:hypothetical protein Y1Q_0018938 [Alligator mississippiensis]
MAQDISIWSTPPCTPHHQGKGGDKQRRQEFSCGLQGHTKTSALSRPWAKSSHVMLPKETLTICGGYALEIPMNGDICEYWDQQQEHGSSCRSVVVVSAFWWESWSDISSSLFSMFFHTLIISERETLRQQGTPPLNVYPHQSSRTGNRGI